MDYIEEARRKATNQPPMTSRVVRPNFYGVRITSPYALHIQGVKGSTAYDITFSGRDVQTLKYAIKEWEENARSHTNSLDANKFQIFDGSDEAQQQLDKSEQLEIDEHDMHEQEVEKSGVKYDDCSICYSEPFAAILRQLEVERNV